MFQRRAQMSIFIVIAVILVLLFIFFFATSERASFSFFADEKPSFKTAELIEACMETLSKEAVEKIGLSGGWLYHPQRTFVSRDTPEQLIKRADGFKDPGNVEISYWHYYDDSDEEFKLSIPHYDTDNPYSMKSQIERYLDENLNQRCLRNFEVFEEIYDIEYELRQIDHSVELDEEDIIVTLDWPVEVAQINTEEKEYVDFFNVKVENKLRVPYFLAREITIAESQSSFLEKRVLQFLNPYQSTKDKSLLPPFYDFALEYDFEPWDVQKVELLTKQIISSHITRIQFLNTDYEEIPLESELQGSEFAASLTSLYTRDYLSEHSTIKEENPGLFRDFEEYRVTPYYDPYIFPTYFSLSPSLGDAVLLPRPQAFVDILPVFFTEYTSVYEISGPVLFQIYEDELGEDFVFNLAVELNIDHNTPLKENYDVPDEIIDLASSLDQGRSLVCDPTQFTSAPISLSLVDPIAHGERERANDPLKGVDDAIVEFECKGITTCYIGKTSKNDVDATELEFSLPENCAPGSLTITKPGHEKIVLEDVNPSGSAIDLGVVELSSSKTLEVDIDIVGENLYSAGKDLIGNEEGFIIFEHVTDEQFVRTLEVNTQNQYDLTIDLLPGNYSVQGFIIYKDEIKIPSEEICYTSGLFSEDCVDIPEINLSSWVRAGIEVSDFVVGVDTLVTKETLIIPLRDFGIPSSFDELEANAQLAGNLQETSPRPYFN